MTGRGLLRLEDIVDAINQIDTLVDDKSFADVFSDRILRAAFERFLEVLSEASRHVPAGMKEATPQIPWADIAAIGNHLRHAYHRVDFEILWRIYEDGELRELRIVAEKLLKS